MAQRRPTSVRFNDAERQIIRTAAREHPRGWTSWIREQALNAAADVLTQEVPELRREREPSGGD